jgi:hypothetical protein
MLIHVTKSRVALAKRMRIHTWDNRYLGYGAILLIPDLNVLLLHTARLLRGVQG